MTVLYTTLAAYAVFGLIIGSFLNVLILRRGTGRTLTGRSSCFSCVQTLAWYELIPLVSWLALRGKCRSCGSRISIQYPLVEGVTALLFAGIGAADLPLMLTVLALVMSALLVAISAYDIRHTIIPDGWVYTFAAAGLAYGILALPVDATVPEIALLLATGPVVALPLWALWYLSGGTWMGLGDAKLMLGIGWVLGPLFAPQALLFAFVIGAFVTIVFLMGFPAIAHGIRTAVQYSALKRGSARFTMKGTGRWTMKSEIPFGPFLVASFYILWVAHHYGIHLPLIIS